MMWTHEIEYAFFFHSGSVRPITKAIEEIFGVTETLCDGALVETYPSFEKFFFTPSLYLLRSFRYVKRNPNDSLPGTTLST